jgi:hypothetical protein
MLANHQNHKGHLEPDKIEETKQTKIGKAATNLSAGLSHQTTSSTTLVDNIATAF